MRTKRTTIRGAVEYIARREEFTAAKGTLFGRLKKDGTYMVFSYRYNYPLAVWEPTVDKWFMHTEKYSRTTSRHQTMVRQAIGEFTELSFDDIRTLVDSSYVALTAERLTQ